MVAGDSYADVGPGERTSPPGAQAASGGTSAPGGGSPDSPTTDSIPKADLSTLLGGEGAATLARVRAGDWKGALTAVGAGLLTMGAAALIGALLLGLLDAGGLLRVAGSLVLLAMGAAVSLTDAAGGAGAAGAAGAAEVSALPLMLTTLGYAVMAFVFLRRLESAPVAVARLQGLRLVLVQAVVVLVLGLLVPGTITSASLGSLGVGFNLLLTELFAASWLVAVLLLAGFVYRLDWLNLRIRAAREQMVGLISGMFAALVVALSLAAVALVVVGIAQGQVAYALVAVLIGLPNIAVVGITTGVAVPLHASGSGAIAGLGGGTSTDLTLSQIATGSSWFWLLPLYAAVCLVVAGIVTAQFAPDLPTARRDSLRLALAVPVVLLVGAWLAGVSGSAGAALFSGAADIYPSYLLVIVAGAVAGAIAGSAGFLLAPRVPARATLLLRQITSQLRLPGTAEATSAPTVPIDPVGTGTSSARVPTASMGTGTSREPAPPAPVAPLRLGTRGRLILAGCAVLLALILGGSVLDKHLANTTFGPAPAVNGYLTDLQNGDANGALGELQEKPGASGLLTNAALAKAVNGGQVRNIHLGAVSVSGDSATVEATFDVGAQSGHQQSFQLAADHVHQHLGRYPTWRIMNPQPELQIQGGSGLTSVTVNGLPIALSGGAATLTALPGRYVVAGPDAGPVTTASQTVLITGPDTGGSVQLQPQLSSTATSQVQGAVDAKFAGCATATVVNPPAPCPGDTVFGTATHFVWNVPAPGSATQVQLDPSGSITFSGNATATVTYVQDQGFGSAPAPQTDTVPYSYSGTVTFSSGTPQISFS